MSFDAKDREPGEQVLPEPMEPPYAASSAPQARVTGRSPIDRSNAAVRSRAPEPQQQPAEPHIVDSPPLHDDQPPEEDAEQGDKPRPGFLRRHPFAVVFGLVLAVPVAAGAYLYWDNTEHFETTDDSFIAARQFAVAPQVAGNISSVPVTDNQHVSTGGVIARIDDRSFRIALDQAKAQLAHDQAVLGQAQRDLARYQTLLRQNSIAGQQAEDQVYVAQQDQATVALDQANVDNAQLNLDRTVVKADQPGQVVNLTGAVGQYAPAGTALTMFVPDEIWVTANFKETQLDAMRPGQPAMMSIDAYPERTIRGHVASVQSGSGPAFSLLPPENATGNWVKIVQRVPVKIVLDHPPADVALGPGMSVETTVRVNPRPSLYERLRGWL
jgi:membrane fusion protein, multidrug efflux system